MEHEQTNKQIQYSVIKGLPTRLGLHDRMKVAKVEQPLIPN